MNEEKMGVEDARTWLLSSHRGRMSARESDTIMGSAEGIPTRVGEERMLDQNNNDES